VSFSAALHASCSPPGEQRPIAPAPPPVRFEIACGRSVNNRLQGLCYGGVLLPRSRSVSTFCGERRQQPCLGQAAEGRSRFPYLLRSCRRSASVPPFAPRLQHLRCRLRACRGIPLAVPISASTVSSLFARLEPLVRRSHVGCPVSMSVRLADVTRLVSDGRFERSSSQTRCVNLLTLQPVLPRIHFRPQIDLSCSVRGSSFLRADPLVQNLVCPQQGATLRGGFFPRSRASSRKCC
jgi:hypothetical protein